MKKLQEEDAREKARMNELIQDLEIQIQNDQAIIGSLEKENKELRFKFETSQRNAEVFCRKIEEEFKEWLERNDGPPLSNQSLSRDLEENIRYVVTSISRAPLLLPFFLEVLCTQYCIIENKIGNDS